MRLGWDVIERSIVSSEAMCNLSKPRGSIGRWCAIEDAMLDGSILQVVGEKLNIPWPLDRACVKNQDSLGNITIDAGLKVWGMMVSESKISWIGRRTLRQVGNKCPRRHSADVTVLYDGDINVSGRVRQPDQSYITMGILVYCEFGVLSRTKKY
jgi:hypothetical protein